MSTITDVLNDSATQNGVVDVVAFVASLLKHPLNDDTKSQAKTALGALITAGLAIAAVVEAVKATSTVSAATSVPAAGTLAASGGAATKAS